MQKRPTTIYMFPKYLWFLMLTYALIIVLTNWVDARLIQLGPIVTDAGTLIFPLTFLLADMITEVYGYKHARRAIWCGFLFNFLCIFYGLIVSVLPSPDFATNNEVFDNMLAVNFRIFAASAFSYLTSEPMNSLVIAKLKIKMQGRHMWLRFLTSTVLAAALDSVIFSVFAFYGTMPNHDLAILIVTMWGLKVAVEVLGLTVSLPVTNKLKRLEQLDIYDDNTKYNLFNVLDMDYNTQNNHYKPEAR